MTLGSTNKEVRALEARIKLLEDSKIIPLFPDSSAEQRANAYTDRAFKRLVIWVIAAAFLGSGLMLVLSKL